MQRLQGVLGARRDGWEKNENKKKKKRPAAADLGFRYPWYRMNEGSASRFQIPVPTKEYQPTVLVLTERTYGDGVYGSTCSKGR